MSEERQEKFNLLVEKIVDVLNLARELGLEDVFTIEHSRAILKKQSAEFTEELDAILRACAEPARSEAVH